MASPSAVVYQGRNNQASLPSPPLPLTCRRRPLTLPLIACDDPCRCVPVPGFPVAFFRRLVSTDPVGRLAACPAVIPSAVLPSARPRFCEWSSRGFRRFVRLRDPGGRAFARLPVVPLHPGHDQPGRPARPRALRFHPRPVLHPRRTQARLPPLRVRPARADV